MKKIRVASNAGFCFGVSRAIKIIYDLLDEGKKVCTLGPIIHNPQIVSELKERGVVIADKIDDIPKYSILVIRSHGVERSVLDELKRKGIKVSDATCPFVLKIHNIVYNHSNMDTIILIAGDKTHPEIKGIKGHCKNKNFIFNDAEELEKILIDNNNFCDNNIIVVAQTTFSVAEWKKSLKKIKNLCTNIKIFDTICNATSERQSEAKKISLVSDIMLIFGGKQSSNTTKLYNVCKQNCPTYLLETAKEIPISEIKKANNIGVTAGASTPAGIIKEAVDYMENILNGNGANENNNISENIAQEVKEEKQLKQDQFINRSKPENIQVESKLDESKDLMNDSNNLNNESESNDLISNNNLNSEENFEEMLEESLKNFNMDNIVEGTVINITPVEVLVDIGRKQSGFIPKEELSNTPDVKPEDIVKVGDKIQLLIMKTNDQEGTIMLSKKRIDSIKAWKELVEAQKDSSVVTGVVTDVIKGGVISNVKGIRVFIPASQATIYRTDKLDDLLNKEVQMRIIEINENRKRAIGSIRSLLQEEHKKNLIEFWKNAEIGKKYKGTVKSMTSYGAFVDIGGIDGMIHVSELSWDRVKKPSDILSIGETVNVYIKGLDPEKAKVSLGYKDPNADPWNTLRKDYAEGSIVEVTITGVSSFGAFAKILPGIEGLIHISQLSDRRIDKAQDDVSVGDKVMAMITSIDFDNKKVGLSIRKLLEGDKISDEEIIKDYVLGEGITLTTEEEHKKEEKEENEENKTDESN